MPLQKTMATSLLTIRMVSLVCSSAVRSHILKPDQDCSFLKQARAHLMEENLQEVMMDITGHQLQCEKTWDILPIIIFITPHILEAQALAGIPALA